MFLFFVLSFRGQILGPKWHRLDTTRHFCVARGDRNILDQILELFSEWDATEDMLSIREKGISWSLLIWIRSGIVMSFNGILIVVLDERLISTG